MGEHDEPSAGDVGCNITSIDRRKKVDVGLGEAEGVGVGVIAEEVFAGALTLTQTRRPLERLQTYFAERTDAVFPALGQRSPGLTSARALGAGISVAKRTADMNERASTFLGTTAER